MYYFHNENFSELPATSPNYVFVRNQQTQTVRYECSKCDSLFSSRMFLHKHEISDHNRLFHCPFCAILFSNKADFRVHVTAHTEKRHLPCSFCKKVFMDADEYRAHIKEHREPLMFTCDQCPAMFSQLSLLRVHSAIHLNKKFIHTVVKISKHKHHRRNKSAKNLSKKKKRSKKHTNVEGSDMAASIAGTATIDSTEESVPPTDFTLMSSVEEMNEGILEINTGISDSSQDQEEDRHLNTNPPDHEGADDLLNRNNRKKGDNRCQNSNPTEKNLAASFKRPLRNASKKSETNLKVRTSSRQLSSKNKKSVQKSSDTSRNHGAVIPETSKNYNLRRRCNVNRVTADRQTSAEKSSSTRTDIRTTTQNYNLRRGSRVNYVTSDTLTSTEKSSSSRKMIASGFFMCLSCKRIFMTYRALNQHKVLHLENRGYRCDKCEGLFGGAGNLIKHKTVCA